MKRKTIAAVLVFALLAMSTPVFAAGVVNRQAKRCTWEAETDCTNENNNYLQILYQLLLTTQNKCVPQSVNRRSTPKMNATTPKIIPESTTLPATNTAVPVTTPTSPPSVIPTSKPISTPAPTKTNKINTGTQSSGMVDQLLELINEDRSKAGLLPYKLNASLSAGALAHSQDMANNNFFSHTSPTKGGLSERVKAAGIKSAVGENIALYGSIEKAHAALMASEGHRKNLMSTGFTQIGIGIIYSPTKGGYYITEWFSN